MKFFKTLMLVLPWFICMHQSIFAQLLPSYSNSWVGNTFGTPAKHIPHSIDNVYVTPSGKIATITGWDEGGHNVVLYGSDGKQIGVPVESGTGSWGRFSGRAVFADDQYIYQIMKQKGCDGNNGNLDHYPVCGTQWFCVRRYFHNGNSASFPGGKGYDRSFLIINSNTTNSSGSPLKGLIVVNNELYVSDNQSNTIKVYSAATMSSTVIRELSVGSSGLLDYDSQGNLWLLDITQQKIIRFSPSGTLMTQQIIFPSAVKATSFCIDKVNNQILVTNNGVDQNVLIYNNIFFSPAQTATFGQTGGINSGTMGEVAPLKFSEPQGVGIDDNGNIYVANNGVWQGGARLEKYTAAAVMQWRLNGLIFTDNGTVDPSSETDFYSKEFHLKLNLNNTTPGTEWSLKGMTINRFAFPEDDRITNSSNLFWTSAYVRNVAGKRFLFVSDMYGQKLAVYKFNNAIYGETAIPSALFGQNSTINTEFIWTDTNNDQLHQNSEYNNIPIINAYSTHIVPDYNGNIWKTNREAGIRFFPMQGINANGNPTYSYPTSTLFRTVSGIIDVKRVEYDNATGALYVAGRSAATVHDNWGCTGNVLSKFDNYLNSPTALPAWTVTTPFFPEGTLEAQNNIKAFCLAGDYVFTILTKFGKIIVREKTTGAIVGEILPNASTGFTSGWSDINGAIQAHKRPNGEYLIFAEENGYGKIMMYRWCPSGNCTTLSTADNTTLQFNKVYPNPTTDSVSINLETTETLYLYNIFGQLIWTKQNALGIQKVEMQNLQSGIYFLKTTVSTYKIIKI